MCLGIPMKIVKIDKDNATVEISGIKHDVNLSLIDEPKIGEYVLIHAGFAIEKLDEREAKETLEMIREIAQGEDQA